MKGEEARRIQGWRIKDWKRKKQGWRIKGRMKVRKGVLRKDGWIHYWKLKLQGWRINEEKVKYEKKITECKDEERMNEWMNECKDLDPGQDFPQVQELKSPSWEQIKYY